VANEILPSEKQLEAMGMFKTWFGQATYLKDALLWLYKNDWYFQTEFNVWTTNNEFQSLINDTASRINNDFVFKIQDTYIYFKSPSMGRMVLLREGASSDPADANRWPNDVIQKEVGFLRHYDSINKSVVLS
jgi:hypothetical protein